MATSTPPVPSGPFCYAIWYTYNNTRIANYANTTAGAEAFVNEISPNPNYSDIDVVPYTCGDPEPSDPNPLPINAPAPNPVEPAPPPSLPPISGLPPSTPAPPGTPSGPYDSSTLIIQLLEYIVTIISGGSAPAPAPPVGISKECCAALATALTAIATAIAQSSPSGSGNSDPVTCAQLKENFDNLINAFSSAWNQPFNGPALPAFPNPVAPTPAQAAATGQTYTAALPFIGAPQASPYTGGTQ